jgi:hypothetical protein
MDSSVRLAKGKRKANSGEKSKKRSRKSSSGLTHNNTKYLNGLTLAVSTQESSSTSKDLSNALLLSYKDVSSLIQSLGGIVTAQVHNRVFGVICNRSSVIQNTQRVRKAIKKGLALIDIEWLHVCQKKKKRVDHTPYLLNDFSKEDSERNKHTKCLNQQDTISDPTEEELFLMNNDVGWSEPVDLDCCCVCHDDNRDDCKWCCEVGKECNKILETRKT